MPTARPHARSGPAEDAGSILPRLLRLLELTASSDRALALPEMSLVLGVPRPTVHRLCTRLEEQGFLAREPGGRHFRPGSKLVAMSLDVLRHDGVGAERHAILEALVGEIGETCNFTIRAGHKVLYLARVESRWPLRLQLEPGSRVPLHCTASGKLFLASLAPARRERLLETLALTPETPRTITSRPALEDELSRIAARGYSTDDQEFLLGLVAIAVPVADAAGRTLAAVACHAPSARFSLEQAVLHLPELKAAAAKLARTFPKG